MNHAIEMAVPRDPNPFFHALDFPINFLEQNISQFAQLCKHNRPQRQTILAFLIQKKV